jgi:hypothetical protein
VENLDLEITVENREILIERIKELKKSLKRIVIGIDGVAGSGKTNLAHYIASELFIDAIHLDHFLVHNLGCYLKALNYGLLMQQLRFREGRSFIIEGCCLLEVIKVLNIQANILIYCKEISRDTKIWHYGNNFDEYVSSHSEDNLSGLDKDILEYHKRVRPWENAHYNYHFFNDLKAQ